MKKINVLGILIFCLSTSAYSVCVTNNSVSLSGTNRAEELITDSIPLVMGTLSEKEQELRPFLGLYLVGARGEQAVIKIMSGFDRDQDQRISYSELDKRFDAPPFEFGWANRKIGIPILLDQFGDGETIDLNGVRSFVAHYGFN